MADINSGNQSQTGSNPEAAGNTYQDWRAQRWEWRRKKMEERRNRPYHGLFGGLTLILLGGLFLANAQGWISGDVWWKYLLIGLGAISIISGLLQYRAPEYRHWGNGRLVWGFALIALGVIFLLGFSQWWPLVIIGVGLACLLRFSW
jgi:hypothetical protein